MHRVGSSKRQTEGEASCLKRSRVGDAETTTSDEKTTVLFKEGEDIVEFTNRLGVLCELLNIARNHGVIKSL